jgi:hypothetical protein
MVDQINGPGGRGGSGRGSGTIRLQGKVRVRMDLRPPAEEAVEEVAAEEVAMELLLGSRGRLGLGWTCSHWPKRLWKRLQNYGAQN